MSCGWLQYRPFLFATFEEASSEDKEEPGDVQEVYYLEDSQGLSGTE